MPRERIIHLTKKDFIRQTFRTGGKGGQRRDKTETGVRFIHPPSGARGECTEHSYQNQNEQVAFRRMAESPKMHVWLMEQNQNYEKITALVEAPPILSGEILIEIRGPDGDWIPADSSPL